MRRKSPIHSMNRQKTPVRLIFLIVPRLSHWITTANTDHVQIAANEVMINSCGTSFQPVMAITAKMAVPLLDAA